MKATLPIPTCMGTGATGSSTESEGYCLTQGKQKSSSESQKGKQRNCSQMLTHHLMKYLAIGGVGACTGERRNSFPRRCGLFGIGMEEQEQSQSNDNRDRAMRESAAGDRVNIDMPRAGGAPWARHSNDGTFCASVLNTPSDEDEEGLWLPGENILQDCSHQHHHAQPEEDVKEEEVDGDYSQHQHHHQHSKSLVLTRRRKSVWRGSLSSISLLLCTLLIITSLAHSSHQQSFFSPSSEEWDGGSFRSGTYGNGYTCVNIPVNFTLCKNIGYTKMMIPNLLGHDSLQEAEFHAKSWVPLLGLQCHPDTQLFLCSLFSPICLDRPIFPCRSLCQGVQAKCEPRMLAYNYPWPSMLKCDQFPEDHDLCIRPGAANKSDGDPELECPSCNQAHTCENIVDNFCRADFVFRAKYKRSKGALVEFRKERWFKPREGNRRGRELRTLSLDDKDDCCATKFRPGFPYIVMGIKRGDESIVTFAMQWKGKDKILKNAVRTFRSMDCTNPLPMSVTAAGGKSGTERNGTATVGRRKRRKQGRRRERQYGGCRVSAPGRN